MLVQTHGTMTSVTFQTVIGLSNAHRHQGGGEYPEVGWSTMNVHYSHRPS